jgi:hypothetical protein
VTRRRPVRPERERVKVTEDYTGEIVTALPQSSPEDVAHASGR